VSRCVEASSPERDRPGEEAATITSDDHSRSPLMLARHSGLCALRRVEHDVGIVLSGVAPVRSGQREPRRGASRAVALGAPALQPSSGTFAPSPQINCHRGRPESHYYGSVVIDFRLLVPQRFAMPSLPAVEKCRAPYLRFVASPPRLPNSWKIFLISSDTCTVPIYERL